MAQVKEPYSVVGYLAQRLDVPRLLKLVPPDCESGGGHSKDYLWSAFNICEGNIFTFHIEKKKKYIYMYVFLYLSAMPTDNPCYVAVYFVLTLKRDMYKVLAWRTK